MEIKDADRIAFLDSPISSTGLFGPAVNGFSECFTEAQKSSQDMRHSLLKRSSSASGRPKKTPPSQPAKPAPPVSQAHPVAETHRRPQPAKRYQLPDCQGPRPKIVLDPEPQKPS